ncbi:MAG TPA: hypothetical protein VFA20_05345 [Myxococcaceae bacterium]|nr:hypothetical protein [Myxococcaceae bacterium]
MTPASLLAALSLLAADPSTDAPTQGSIWVNGGGVLLTATGGGTTIDVPLGATIPIPNGPTLSFELTYFQWSCTGASCNVNFERGVFASAGFHFDTEGKGPLRGFFLEPKLQLSGFSRSFIGFPAYDGLSLGAELGLDLGYQWRLGQFYVAVILGASGGVATHYPSILYGLLVEWNGSATGPAQLVPKPLAYVFSLNLNLARVGFTF